MLTLASTALLLADTRRSMLRTAHTAPRAVDTAAAAATGAVATAPPPPHCRTAAATDSTAAAATAAALQVAEEKSEPAAAVPAFDETDEAKAAAPDARLPIRAASASVADCTSARAEGRLSKVCAME